MSDARKARPQGRTPAASIRGERDRFVAFAFCAADILLELDSRHIVTYAGGATLALTGRPAGGLVGTSVFDLVPPDEQPLLCQLLDRATAGARLDQVGLHMVESSGRAVPFTLAGYHLPDLDGHYFLALRIEEPHSPAVTLDAAARDPETGLPGAQDFSKTGAAQLREALARGESATFTVLDLNGLAELRKRLDVESRRALMSTLGNVLRENSLGGDAAGALGDECYGLLHDSGLDVKRLETKIDDLAVTLDPKGRGLDIKAAAVDMGATGLDGVGAAQAFVHAVKCFEKAEADTLTIGSIADGLSRRIEETVKRIGDARSVIAARAFDFAFQPIVDLETRRIHHFEALMRLRDGGGLTPFQFVRFAEEIGLICDFDITVCSRVIAWLEEAHRAGHAHIVAVNISGRSLSSPQFVSELLDRLKKHDWLSCQLFFELTESASIPDLGRTNAIIQGLRRSGFGICLDDFGAGESAFHYLRALDVDMVKIDGSYVRDALADGKDRHFLKSIAGLCNDLGISTIAEMIEQEETIKLLQACGVKFGQGYLFGRPSLDITAFDARRSNGPPALRTYRSRWR